MNLPKNPEEYALEHLNRSARFARCARSLAALAAGMLFFPVASCCFLRFRRSSLKSLKNRPPSFQNHPQNHPKSFKKRARNLQKTTPEASQIHPKTLQNRGLEVVWAALGAMVPLPSLFFQFLEASWGRLGRVLAASWALLRRLGGVSGASWALLGASWGRLGASWRSLGADFPSKREPN